MQIIDSTRSDKNGNFEFKGKLAVYGMYTVLNSRRYSDETYFAPDSYQNMFPVDSHLITLTGGPYKKKADKSGGVSINTHSPSMKLWQRFCLQKAGYAIKMLPFEKSKVEYTYDEDWVRGVMKEDLKNTLLVSKINKSMRRPLKTLWPTFMAPYAYDWLYFSDSDFSDSLVAAMEQSRVTGTGIAAFKYQSAKYKACVAAEKSRADTLANIRKSLKPGTRAPVFKLTKDYGSTTRPTDSVFAGSTVVLWFAFFPTNDFYNFSDSLHTINEKLGGNAPSVAVVFSDLGDAAYWKAAGLDYTCDNAHAFYSFDDWMELGNPQGSITRKYGVTDFPYWYVIDRQGRIVNQGLSAKQLEQTLLKIPKGQ